jgi:hypothetical protein
MSHNSEVWQFFELNSVDTTHAKCTVCKALISRGRQGAPASSFTTSNMRKHLKNVHGELLRSRKPNAVSAAPDASAPSTSKHNITIAKAFDSKKSRGALTTSDRERYIDLLETLMI